MKKLSRSMFGIGLLAVLAAACSTTARQVGPVAGVQPRVSPVATDGRQPRYTAADVRFMQHMIAHHAQALAMSGLVPTRSGRDDIRLLAQRIEVSQKDEIAQMQRWLRDRSPEIPSAHPHHGHHRAGAQQAAMPGMLTHEELTRLAAATGSEFDRLFWSS